MMVPAVALGPGRASELGAEDDQRPLEHATPLEILEQPGDRLVNLGCLAIVAFLDFVVSVPLPGTSGPMVQLNKRTPFSTNRRAARHCVPNSRECSRSRPYRLWVAWVSVSKFMMSGTAVCMPAASSYDRILALSCGSSGYSIPTARFSFPIRSSSAACSSAVTPCPKGLTNGSGLAGSVESFTPA
ncbi:MAG: hypothetical protein Ct9H300mP1_33050 [Planctomycetaceae bacterium]|nr:MAG: hypothetical protein Ct9H300mP1_33050 [Planctomycetaceae bacterium]